MPWFRHIGHVFLSWHVIFNEHSFLFKRTAPSPLCHSTAESSKLMLLLQQHANAPRTATNNSCVSILQLSILSPLPIQNKQSSPALLLPCHLNPVTHPSATLTRLSQHLVPNSQLPCIRLRNTWPKCYRHTAAHRLWPHSSQCTRPHSSCPQRNMHHSCWPNHTFSNTT